MSHGRVATTPGLAIPEAVPQTLSGAQRTFNALLARIETQRALMQEWEAALPPYRQRWNAELRPALDARYGALAELALFLDAAYGWKGLSAADRKLLADCIRKLSLSVMHGGDDALRQAHQALHDKYDDAPTPRATPDTTPAPIADPPQHASEDEAAQFQRLHDEMEAAQARAQAERDARRNARKKTSKQRQQEADAQQASQSVRDIYRKLASALHPDREQDPTERARKTVLMQRANEAYAANRLLDLLQLQLEAEQIDPARMATLSEARLAPYNRLLTEQLAELERENLATVQSLRGELGLGPDEKVTPATVGRLLRQTLQWLQADLQALQRDRRALVDADDLKAWLKAQR